MYPSNPLASNLLPKSDNGVANPRGLEDVMYQGVTIAAILMVLCSVLLF